MSNDDDLHTLDCSTISVSYCCEYCNYECPTKFLIKQHVKTLKHASNYKNKMGKVYSLESPEIIENEYSLYYNGSIHNDKNQYGVVYTPNGKYYKCNHCAKQYKQRSGLWRHNKKCVKMHQATASTKKKPVISNKMSETNDTDDGNKSLAIMLKTMLEPILLNIQEDKKLTIGLLQTQNKIITDIIPKIGNNNSNNNNSFNINVFLNEQCRDAINMSDFLNSLQVKLADLMYTKNNGLVEGISSVFVKALNKLEQCKRPIHCSDVKRETLYIKDNDAWQRENSKEKLHSAIERVAMKQQKTIFEWEKENKDWHESDARAQEYISLVRAVTKDIASEENKIIRSIIKETTISKSNGKL